MAKTMKILTAAFAAAWLLSAVLLRIFDAEIFSVLAITFATTFYHFAMRLCVGYGVDRIMGNQANPDSRWFRIRQWEPGLYKRLGVRSWKMRLPTYSPANFSPRERTWRQIVMAGCQAEVVHTLIAALSFLPVAAGVWFGAWAIFILTGVFAAGFDLLFVILQRYNRPRLLRMAQKEEK